MVSEDRPGFPIVAQRIRRSESIRRSFLRGALASSAAAFVASVVALRLEEMGWAALLAGGALPLSLAVALAAFLFVHGRRELLPELGTIVVDKETITLALWDGVH